MSAWQRAQQPRGRGWTLEQLQALDQRWRDLHAEIDAASSLPTELAQHFHRDALRWSEYVRATSATSWERPLDPREPEAWARRADDWARQLAAHRGRDAGGRVLSQEPATEDDLAALPAWRRAVIGAAPARVTTAPPASSGAWRRAQRVSSARALAPIRTPAQLAATLDRTWEALEARVRAARTDPDPLGPEWREAWSAQIAAWRSTRGSIGEDLEQLRVWSARLRPWLEEYQRRISVPGVGAMTRRQLETEIARLDDAWRTLKRDVERFPRGEENPFSDEWRTQFAAAYQRWRDWREAVLDASSLERAFWAEETEDELVTERGELERYRAQYQEITGEPPSGALPAPVDRPPLVPDGTGFLAGLAGGATGVALLVLGLFGLAIAARR